MMPTRRAHAQDALVDEQPVHVRRHLPTITVRILHPAWVVDQLLERTAELHAVMDLQSGVLRVVPALCVAEPLADRQLRQGVYCRVEPIEETLVGSIFDNQIAVEIEEEVVEVRRDSCSHVLTGS
jgi:hypothetical protein